MIQAMIGRLLSEGTLHGLVSHLQINLEVWDEANIQSPPQNAGIELSPDITAYGWQEPMVCDGSGGVITVRRNAP